jgi:hypothetical protein
MMKTTNQPIVARSMFLAFLVSSVLLLGPAAIAQDPQLQLPTEQEAKQALEAVRKTLVAELRLERHLGPNSRLADKLSELNADDFGTFVGSVAGGDADAAFNSIGKIGAEYFLADLKSKLSSIEFEGKELLQYVPLDSTQSLEILQDLWWGKGRQAADKCRKMVREQAIANLKTISINAVTKSLDWALGYVTGGSPGTLFVRIVESEMWFLNVSQRVLDQAFENKLSTAQSSYNELRDAGQSPSGAFDELANRADQDFFSHALNSRKGELPVLFEERYLLTDSGMELRRKMNLQQQAACDAAAAAVREEIARELAVLQKLTRDKAGPTLQSLLDATAAARKELAIMDLCLKLVAERRVKLTNIQARGQRITNQCERYLRLTQADPSERDGSSFDQLQKRGQELRERINDLADAERGLDFQLSNLREMGRKRRDEVREICASSRSDSAAAQKRAQELCQNITKLIPRVRQRWAEQAANPPKYLAEIRAYQLSAAPIEQIHFPLAELREELKQLENDWRNEQSTFDGTSQRFDAAERRFRAIIAPLKKSLGIPDGKRHDLEIDADTTVWSMDGTSDEPGLRPSVQRLFDELRTDFEQLQKRGDDISELVQEIGQWRMGCHSVLTLDVSAELGRFRDKQQRFERYIAALRALIVAVLDCTGLSRGEQLAADLALAEKLLREAQELGGKLLDQFEIAEQTSDRIEAMHSTLSRVSESARTAAADLPDLLVRCGTALNVQREAAEEVQRAAVAASGDLEELKAALQKVTSLLALVQGMTEQVASVTDAQHCKNLCMTARQTAAISAQAAATCRVVAQRIQGRYQVALRHADVQTWDQVQRDVGSKTTLVRRVLAELQATLGVINSRQLNATWQRFCQAQQQVEYLSGEVLIRTEQISGLLEPHQGDERAVQILTQSRNVAEIAIRRRKELGPQSIAAKTKYTACQGILGEISSVKEQLSAALATLSATANNSGGAAINLLRSYADTADVFAAKAETQVAAAEKQAVTICQDCSRRFAPQPTQANPPDHPDISDLTSGVQRDDVPPTDGSRATAPPDLQDLTMGVTRDHPPNETTNGDESPPNAPPIASSPGNLNSTDTVTVLSRRYRLYYRKSPSAAPSPTSFELLWKSDGERATAVVQLVATAPAEERAEYQELGFPTRMELTGQKQGEGYLVRDQALDRALERLLTVFAGIGDSVGDLVIGVASGFTVGPDSASRTRVQVHRTDVLVTFPGNEARLKMDIDFSTLSGNHPPERKRETAILLGQPIDGSATGR